MDIKNYILDNYLKKTSSRHHYIPKFLIEKFRNAESLVYIYDKKKNLIQKKPRSTKSIFFENDRNSIELEKNIFSSVIEDKLYSKIDNDASQVLDYFEKCPLNQIEFHLMETAKLHFFILALYWRIPLTDSLSLGIFKESQIDSTEINSEIIRADPAYQKLQRSRLVLDTIEQIKKYGEKGIAIQNIHECENENIILGDNPWLLKQKQQFLHDFSSIDFVFPISSTRIFSSTAAPLKNFNAYFYNAAIIHQSVNYVCSGNLELLNKSVELYNVYKELGVENRIHSKVFNPTED